MHTLNLLHYYPIPSTFSLAPLFDKAEIVSDISRANSDMCGPVAYYVPDGILDERQLENLRRGLSGLLSSHFTGVGYSAAVDLESSTELALSCLPDPEALDGVLCHTVNALKYHKAHKKVFAWGNTTRYGFSLPVTYTILNILAVLYSIFRDLSLDWSLTCLALDNLRSQLRLFRRPGFDFVCHSAFSHITVRIPQAGGAFSIPESKEFLTRHLSCLLSYYEDPSAILRIFDSPSVPSSTYLYPTLVKSSNPVNTVNRC